MNRFFNVSLQFLTQNSVPLHAGKLGQKLLFVLRFRNVCELSSFK